MEGPAARVEGVSTILVGGVQLVVEVRRSGGGHLGYWFVKTDRWSRGGGGGGVEVPVEILFGSGLSILLVGGCAGAGVQEGTWQVQGMTSPPLHPALGPGAWGGPSGPWGRDAALPASPSHGPPACRQGGKGGECKKRA